MSIDGYAPVAEVARLFDLTDSQVYRLAYRHDWRKITVDGKARYRRSDVRRVLDPEADEGDHRGYRPLSAPLSAVRRVFGAQQ